MFWHPQGTYLAVQVDRFTKSKKTINTSFELFSLKVTLCPLTTQRLNKLLLSLTKPAHSLQCMFKAGCSWGRT